MTTKTGQIVTGAQVKPILEAEQDVPMSFLFFDTDGRASESWRCGKCKRVLAKIGNLEVSGIVLKCPKCESLNDFD